jgi:hypothetical protein
LQLDAISATSPHAIGETISIATPLETAENISVATTLATKKISKLQPDVQLEKYLSCNLTYN